LLALRASSSEGLSLAHAAGFGRAAHAAGFDAAIISWSVMARSSFKTTCREGDSPIFLEDSEKLGQCPAVLKLLLMQKRRFVYRRLQLRRGRGGRLFAEDVNSAADGQQHEDRAKAGEEEGTQIEVQKAGDDRLVWVGGEITDVDRIADVVDA
jgi:hypothetical protein